MADLEVEESTQRQIQPFVLDVELRAGEKLADNAELLAFAQKTVPAGLKVTARVQIVPLKIEEV